MRLSEISPKRAIVFAPHADDEILGAAGFIANARKDGWDVHVYFATVSGFSSAFRGDHSQDESRMSEVERAMKVLDVANYEVLFKGEEKHLKLDTVPQTEIVSWVEKATQKVKPTISVIPCQGHYHQDHRALNDACVAAYRPAPPGLKHFVPIVIAYGHSAAGWGGEVFNFRPNFFADITSVIDLKLESLACYESQLCEYPHPRSLEGVRHNAASWGAYSGSTYAEPYECLRFILNDSDNAAG